MHASPSIQEIASALARTASPPRPTTRTASRILCLRLQGNGSAGFKRISREQHDPMQAVVEAFLKYSPRVQWRPLAGSHHLSHRAGSARQEGVGFVFIDIASTSHLYHGEEGLMRSAQSLARDLGFSVQCAVADTPAGAQAFATSYHVSDLGGANSASTPSESAGIILPPGEERERLKQLSLPYLLHLEGLEAWPKPTAIENIITFFMMLGFKTAEDLSRFTFASLQERWGETGALLWKRLNAQDRQVISALVPTEPLEDYVHLDFPVSLVSLLLHQTQKSVDFLFARLQGRRSFARKLVVTLHCEYSKTQYKIEIEPNLPSRDRNLFLTLLENRLGELDLQNPIRDFEVHVEPIAEKSSQLDFFEPRETANDKVQTLFSLLTQSKLKPGMYRIEPSIRPEGGWRLATALEDGAAAHDMLNPRHYAVSDHHPDYVGNSGEAIAPQPHYGASVMHAPRPTRILRVPSPLSLDELQKLKVLSSNPIERLEDAWWETDESGRPPMKRDYYFAVSPEGQCLWIYQDLRTEEYFLHGYFD